MQLKAYVKLLEFLDMYNNLLNLSKHVARKLWKFISHKQGDIT